MMKATLIFFFSLFIVAGAIAQKHMIDDRSLLIGNSQAQKKDSVMMPLLKASIAGKGSGEMTKEDLLNAKTIEVSDPAYQVLEYRMFISGPGVEYKEFSAGGNEFTDVMRAAIKAAPAGAKIYFEYIKYGKVKCDNRLSPPISITLK